MVGRAAYDHPLRWGAWIGNCFGVADTRRVGLGGPARLIPYVSRCCGGRRPALADRPSLVHLVGRCGWCPHWRRHWGEPLVCERPGAKLLEQAAVTLEQAGL